MAVFFLACISYQDCKERTVYWFLFPILGLVLGLLHSLHCQISVFGLYALSNILAISMVLLMLYGYTRFLRKKQFLDTSFGLGDFLFFYAFAVGFPTLTFLILFIFSLFFSLIVFLLFKKNMTHKTVPLAGLQSLFLLFVLLSSFLLKSPSLYTL